MWLSCDVRKKWLPFGGDLDLDSWFRSHLLIVTCFTQKYALLTFLVWCVVIRITFVTVSIISFIIRKVLHILAWRLCVGFVCCKKLWLCSLSVFLSVSPMDSGAGSWFWRQLAEVCLYLYCVLHPPSSSLGDWGSALIDLICKRGARGCLVN